MPGISILVQAGTTAATCSVTATGSVQHIILDAEATSFGLSDSALKSAVAKYFGQSPDNAYLHSSTPWGDLYTTYSWPQVTTTIAPISATITNLTSNPTILATQQFVNESSEEGTYNCSIAQNVSNTVSTTWSTTETITVTQEIDYEIGFLGEGGGGSTSLEFGMTFGQGGSQTQAVEVGSSAGVVVNLQPGQTVDAQLSASQGTLSISIVYQASLSGSVAVNYATPYKGHHFYALPVAAVMQAAGISNAMQFTEALTVGYFTNSEVELTDPLTRSKVAVVKAVAATGTGLVRKA